MSEQSRRTGRGVLVLLGTTVLWGSSFPAIKFVVSGVSEYTYTWLRSLVAMTGLAPYVAYRAWRHRGLGRGFRGGLEVGVAYALGLWLQAWGTRFTTASNSAFITGLNVVFVHLYAAVVVGRYSARLAASLASAVGGLYLLSSPGGGLGMGDMLVLLGAFFWAAQIVLVDKYSGEDPLILTFAEMAPALLFVLPDILAQGPRIPGGPRLLAIVYLGLACSDAAFALQFYGQRFVEPAVAAIVFLTEPVIASLLAAATLHEHMAPIQILGASLILASLALAALGEAPKKYKHHNPTHKPRSQRRTGAVV